MSSVGFPFVHQLNDTRNISFKLSHNWDRENPDMTTKAKAGCWLNHKSLTVCSIPANTLSTGVGLAGMAVTAATLGTAKVAVFAISLGNQTLPIDTGFTWFGNRTAHSVWHLLLNTGELAYDTGNVVYRVVQVAPRIAKVLHIEEEVKAILRRMGQGLDFAARRIEKGFVRAGEAEKGNEFSWDTPPILSWIDKPTEEVRINMDSASRPWDKIVKHGLLSVVNVPLNGAVAVCSGVATAILGTAFVGKAIFYATTNIDIPVPTYAGVAAGATFSTSSNVVIDAANNVGDGFVSLYKTSAALGINRVLTTALGVIEYIPKALFTDK